MKKELITTISLQIGQANSVLLLKEQYDQGLHYFPYQLCNEIYYNVVCATSKGSDQPAHTRSLIRAFASRFNIL